MLLPITLYRYDGAGNDFLVFDAAALTQLGDVRSDPQADVKLAVLAREWCRREAAHGGADGLLLILPAAEPGNDFCLRIYNADGSIAEMCGNGMRCAVFHWLWAQAKNTSRSELSRNVVRVETLAGRIEGELLSVSEDVIAQAAPSGTSARIRLEMGKPRFTWESLNYIACPGDDFALEHASSLDVFPVDIDGKTLMLYGASLGNPHVVAFVKDVDQEDLARIGSLIEHDPHFARGTNVHLVRVLDLHQLQVRHWERGCGLTRACGTGAVAAAVIAIAKGLVASPVQVTVPGGTLTVTWQGEGAQLEGPVLVQDILELPLPASFA